MAIVEQTGVSCETHELPRLEREPFFIHYAAYRFREAQRYPNDRISFKMRSGREKANGVRFKEHGLRPSV